MLEDFEFSVEETTWGRYLSDSDDLTPEMRQGLRVALVYGGNTHQLRHVIDAVDECEAQLWIDEETAIVTEVNDTPLVRELHCWVATGTLAGIVDLSNKVMEWGRSVGCEVATLSGRQGWTKALRKEGWNLIAVEMAKPL